MQEFMVVAFEKKKEEVDELEKWLYQMQEEGRYVFPELRQISISRLSNIIMIDNACSALGPAIRDKGFRVRMSVWKDIK
jgi:hypothetical protein